MPDAWRRFRLQAISNYPYRADHLMTIESTARRPFHAVILAGGRGTRMQSNLPKLLHPIAGRALLQWVIDAAQRAGAASVTVVLPPN